MSEQKSTSLKYPPGSVLVMTTGEYSDFGVVGILVTMQECDLPALAKEYANGKPSYEPAGMPNNFPAWLISKGYAMPVDHSEVHLGDYGRWGDEFDVVPGDD